MTTYSVQTQQMQDAIDQAQQISTTIGTMLSSLESTLGGTLNTWTGDAQAAYTVQQKKWSTAAQQMPQTLTASAQTLQGINDLYGGAERVATQTFHG